MNANLVASSLTNLEPVRGSTVSMLQSFSWTFSPPLLSPMTLFLGVNKKAFGVEGTRIRESP